MSENEFIDKLLEKFVEQAINYEKRIIMLKETNFELATANKLLVEENLRLTTEIAELNKRIEIMKINK